MQFYYTQLKVTLVPCIHKRLYQKFPDIPRPYYVSTNFYRNYQRPRNLRSLHDRNSVKFALSRARSRCISKVHALPKLRQTRPMPSDHRLWRWQSLPSQVPTLVNTLLPPWGETKQVLSPPWGKPQDHSPNYRGCK